MPKRRPERPGGWRCEGLHGSQCAAPVGKAPPQWVCSHCNSGYNNLAQHYRRNPGCWETRCAAGSAVDIGEEEPDGGAEPPGAAGVATALAEVGFDFQRASLQSTVAWDLLDLRHQHGLRDGQVGLVKKLFTKWIGQRDAMCCHVMEDVLQPGISPEQVAAALGRISMFEGIETNK
jgi:hypothetical protein